MFVRIKFSVSRTVVSTSVYASMVLLGASATNISYNIFYKGNTSWDLIVARSAKGVHRMITVCVMFSNTFEYYSDIRYNLNCILNYTNLMAFNYLSD